MRVLPPGPYLPRGAEAKGEVDLGVRLRDKLYTRKAVGEAREALGQLLPVVIHHGDFEAASRVCQAWLETWPAAALVDEARRAWRAKDDTARAVLERVTELHGLARGWELLPSGLALMPDLGWIADQLGDAAEAIVVSRGEEDGSEAIAAMLGTTVGELAFTHAALEDEPPVSWADRLWPAKPQELGERMVRRCEVASLPGSPERLARGDASEVGWLLWDGPHPPRPVHPAAVALVEALEQPMSRAELVQATGWKAGELDTALESLASAGAIGPAAP